MEDGASIVHHLVEIADNLTDNFDVIELLTKLADKCVNLLGISAAGVMIASSNGDLRLVASSSEAMRLVELFELQAREGPCLDAYQTGEAVGHEILRPGSGRWPRFSAVALESNFCSVFALPMRLRNQTIGALNLFSSGLTPINEEHVDIARGFADLATISIMQHRAATEARVVRDQLSQALTSRISIEQAKGILSERTGITPSEAFVRIRDYARSHNLRLTEVAQAAINGTGNRHL
jgi:GAF domain-containing protein